VIEPDGPVGAIPMQALMDRRSQYLGERFAIANSERSGGLPAPGGGAGAVKLWSEGPWSSPIPNLARR